MQRVPTSPARDVPAAGWLRPRFGVVSFMCAWLAVGVVCSAQPFEKPPIDTKYKNNGSIIKRYVKAPDQNQDKQELYEEYFTRYFFPALMQSSPEDLGRVGDHRYSLFKDYLWPATPEVQRDLTIKAYGYARNVLNNSSRYHPAVAYNAVLVMGGLDAEYGSDARSSSRPPKPLPQANAELCRIVRESIEGKLPISLQAGALVGLERHAKNIRGLPGNPSRARSNTFRALIAAANQTDFPDGTNDEVKGWIKRQACQGLANLGVPGPRGVFAAAVVSAAGDESLPLEFRCDIAGLLAEMNFEGARGVDAAAALETLRRLAADRAEADRTTAEEFRELEISGGRSRAISQFLDHKRFVLEESQVQLRRTTVAKNLQNMQNAFDALKPLAGERAAEIDAYSQAFNDALLTTNDEDQLDLDVAKALLTMAEKIEGMTPAEQPSLPENATAESDVPSADASVTR